MNSSSNVGGVSHDDNCVANSKSAVLISDYATSGSFLRLSKYGQGMEYVHAAVTIDIEIPIRAARCRTGRSEKHAASSSADVEPQAEAD